MSQNQAPTTSQKKEKASSSLSKKSPAKKEEETEEPEVKRPSPQEVRRAAHCLAQAYALDERPDPDLPESDIVLDVSISMRVGPQAPLIIHESRTIRDILCDPDIVSAPQEFEATIRQLMLPLFKAVQRETSKRMEDAPHSLDSPNAFRSTMLPP